MSETTNASSVPAPTPKTKLAALKEAHEYLRVLDDMFSEDCEDESNNRFSYVTSSYRCRWEKTPYQASVLQWSDKQVQEGTSAFAHPTGGLAISKLRRDMERMMKLATQEIEAIENPGSAASREQYDPMREAREEEEMRIRLLAQVRDARQEWLERGEDKDKDTERRVQDQPLLRRYLAQQSANALHCTSSK